MAWCCGTFRESRLGITVCGRALAVFADTGIRGTHAGGDERSGDHLSNVPRSWGRRGAPRRLSSRRVRAGSHARLSSSVLGASAELSLFQWPDGNAHGDEVGARAAGLRIDAAAVPAKNDSSSCET